MIITFSLFSLGYVLTRLLGIKDKLERLGLGFFLTFGLIGFSLFGLTLLNIPLNTNIAYMFVGLSCISFLLSIKDFRGIRISGWWRLIVILIGISFLTNLYQPPITWDSLTLYDFRAKLFANGMSYRDLFLNLSKYGGDFGYYTNGYPPLISLVTSLSYLINESVMPLFSGALLAFVLLFYSLMTKYASKKVGVIFSLILASTSIIFYHSTIYYSNLFYSILLSLSVLYLYDFSNTKKTKSLLLCYFLLIISSWVRMTEPFYILIFVISIMVTIPQKKISNILLCVGLVVITLLSRSGWQSYVNSFSAIEVSTQTSKLATASHTLARPINYLIEIIQTLKAYDYSKTNTIINYIVRATDIYLYLIVTFVLFGISKYKHSVHNLIFWFVILSCLTMIVGVAYFSITIPFWNEITDSARRMMIFTIPCMLFFIGANVEKNK